jgi:hypothetical protein
MLFGETAAVYCENHTEHTDTVRTSQETHYVSTIEPNRLMLFGEAVAVYCENHTEHTDTVCGQNAGFWYVKTGGTYSDRLLLEGLAAYRVHETLSRHCRAEQSRAEQSMWDLQCTKRQFVSLYSPSDALCRLEATGAIVCRLI